ncbi:nitroreductase family protein [Spiroplasma endosymbiont of Polydrusus cervinus]|uniref:nitroreductase family protein n=1 Tax=Spiroplasma endosymbiont of Polydrusus cervinus TaxID=3066287 RepID=UPI0030D5F080
MSVQGTVQFRKAIKIYDKIKTVNEADLKTILATGTLAPSSNGLEPVKVIIKDQKLKEQAALKCFMPGNQQKVKDAPVLALLFRSKWRLFNFRRIFDKSIRSHFYWGNIKNKCTWNE